MDMVIWGIKSKQLQKQNKKKNKLQLHSVKSSSNSERANLRVLKLNERPTFSMKACNFPEKSELSSVKTRTTKNILKDKEAQKNECLKQEATNTHIKKTHFTKRKTGHQMLWRTKKEKTVREI